MRVVLLSVVAAAGGVASWMCACSSFSTSNDTENVRDAALDGEDAKAEDGGDLGCTLGATWLLANFDDEGNWPTSHWDTVDEIGGTVARAAKPMNTASRALASETLPSDGGAGPRATLTKAYVGVGSGIRCRFQIYFDAYDGQQAEW